MRQVLYHSLSSKFITTGEWNVALQKFSSMLKEISTTFLACFNPFIYNVVKWPNSGQMAKQCSTKATKKKKVEDTLWCLLIGEIAMLDDKKNVLKELCDNYNKEFAEYMKTAK